MYKIVSDVRHVLFSSALAWLAVAPWATASWDITSPATAWSPIDFTGTTPDWYDDQQTGQQTSDIVGTNGAPAFYMWFDDNGTSTVHTDGNLAFRVRLSISEAKDFAQCFWVGINANPGADGSMDIFAGVNNTGSKNQLVICPAGNGLNISPNTTTIGSPAYSYNCFPGSNYWYVPVTITNNPGVFSTDIDGNGPDVFLNFMVPFTNIVSALAAVGISNVTDMTPLQFIAATATQANSLNQDLCGPPKNFDANATWASLGTTTLEMAALQIPEPSTGILVLLGYAALLIRHRRREPARGIHRGSGLQPRFPVGV